MLSDPTTRRALLELALLGIAGGALGCWVVLQSLAYGAESLAHAMLPGLVGAALLGLPLVAGAGAGVLAGAAATAAAGRLPGVGRDAAVATVVTALLGAGVLLALSPATPLGLQALLFGDVLAVSDRDLVVAGALAVLVVGVLAAGHHALVAVAFDRDAARALGRRPAVADLALAGLLAAVLLVAVPALGNLLVVALLVGPAAAARLLARRLAPMLATAAVVAVAASAAGLAASYHLRTAAGASVVAALVAAPVVAAAVSGSRRRPRAA